MDVVRKTELPYA